MRFIADGMLGKLSRWLRILGYDVEYSNNLGDKELIETARIERRILLTRDFQLFQQASMRGIESFLVEGTVNVEKLAILANRFDLRLEVNVSLSRCPKCNTAIKVIQRERVVGRVPDKALSRYESFWECPNCMKIYWQGSHWQRINQTLLAAEKQKFSSRKRTSTRN